MAEPQQADAAPRPFQSVRSRLLAIALLPTLVVLPLLLGIAITRWSAKYDEALISKIHGDLVIADQYLSRLLEMTQERLVGIAGSARLRDMVAAGVPLETYLGDQATRLDLDFLYLVAPDGDLAASALPAAGARRLDWPVILAAHGGRSRTEIDLFSEAELGAISADLAARSRFALVPTANAVPTERRVETRGMVIHSATPVTLGDGRPAALVGGILLNRNLVFIDTINDLVYRAGSLPEGSHGTATLFLDDVRISTNVRLFEGSRALGTRVSAAVRAAVLGEGRTWLDRAFVVNDWYISAYQPIIDSFGARIGMLYVGFLEQPFRRTKTETLLTICLAFLTITAASIPILLRWARGIFRPLERMTETIGDVEQGNLAARTGLSAGGDEIGRVATHLDHLLDQIQERDRELRAWNDELNRRVEERTRELQIANTRLEATTKQLIMSEKLAAIGEITAGVAHEINNPIAVMQGNLEIVRSVMGDRAADAATELRLLDEQIHRISQIVTKLLQFAKPEEYADSIGGHSPTDAISDCMPLVQHLLHRSNIEVVRRDDAGGLVRMNPTELQQVLVNLIVNAIHAMPDGGSLTLVTADEVRGDRAGIVIVVADTGIGMAPETLSRIFDPFFSTKRREGTGLGLSISQTLIGRQGGTIEVESTPGAGTTFTVWLPSQSG